MISSEEMSVGYNFSPIEIFSQVKLNLARSIMSTLHLQAHVEYKLWAVIPIQTLKQVRFMWSVHCVVSQSNM